jgi:hypothetical protein
MRLLFCILAALCLCAGCSRTDDRSEVFGFVAPPFEENAQTGVPEQVEETLNYQSLEVKAGYVVAFCTNLSVGLNNQVDVYFSSDADNIIWVRLLLLDEEGSELGSTGILKPGEYVQSVILDTVPDSAGVIQLKVISYEPDTYYSYGTVSASVFLEK